MLAIAPELVHPEHYTAELPPVRQHLHAADLERRGEFRLAHAGPLALGNYRRPAAGDGGERANRTEAEARLVADLMDEALASAAGAT